MLQSLVLQFKKHISSIVFVQILLGVILSLTALILFAHLTKEVLEKETLSVDSSIAHAIYALRNPTLTTVMIYVSFFGADYMILFAGIVTILLAWKKHKREAIVLLMVLILGVVLNEILKFIFQRPRPDFSPILDLSHSYSFPSGHSMNSFIFYTTLAYFVYHFTRNKLLTTLASIGAVFCFLLIGFSRVYLGVHYPSDVIAGYMAGFFVFVTVLVLDRSIRSRKH